MTEALFKHISLTGLYEDEVNRTVEFFPIGSFDQFQHIHRNLYCIAQGHYKLSKISAVIDWPTKPNALMRYKVTISPLQGIYNFPKNYKFGIYIDDFNNESSLLIGAVPIRMNHIVKNHLNNFYNGRIKSVHALTRNSKIECSVKVIFNYRFYQEENELIARLEHVLE